MAIKYGFFNAVDGDREYNADNISDYFKGLISNGVYESLDGALQVMANSSHGVAVKTGRMMIDGHYFENTEDLTISLPVKGSAFYYAVSVIMDRTNRTMTLSYKSGTTSQGKPVKPSLARDSRYYEMVLAYIYADAGNNIIQQSKIEDMRPDNAVCGWVTGLIKQVNTSTLFAQYEAAYATFYQSFQEWFQTLTEQLMVNEYIKAYDKVDHNAGGSALEITLNMEGYVYEASDIISVSHNGLTLIPGQSYIVEAGNPAKIKIVNTVLNPGYTFVRVLKNVIGNPPAYTINANTDFIITGGVI